MNGQENGATISYNSTSQTLLVAFTTILNGTQVSSYLNQRVDLSYLPNRVIVGFSAATGAKFAVHMITSWNFNSSPDDDNGTSGVNSVVPLPSTSSQQGQPAVALGVGRCIALVGALCFVCFILGWNKLKTAGESEEDPC
ncbi:unnamed protein product [Prunus armeniaca]|uniref:Legume lectin domain-containing protein n=1 Tax=Prunus armeniaca TaxID=36596 RepID=A0A6J5UN82_PRUAR|nr:unnamed protein product [Prunus armeniaca]